MQEKIVVGQGGEYPLNGMLVLPDEGTAPYPAVVFVHGSGPSDMDSKVFNVSPFKDMAEGLAKHGVASIRYDKRTFVYAKKMAKAWDGTVKEETIEDAVLATELLRSDARIDSSRIFIAGLSMGGLLAPRIDAEGGNYAGLIIMAGTPRRLEDAMKSQQDDFLSKSNAVIRWLAKGQIKKLNKKFDNIYNLSDEEARKTPIIGKQLMAIYFKDMGQKQVREYLEGSTKPVLVMQGDGDFHVDIEKDFNEYKDILKNNPNAKFILYPGLNHVFMPTVYGDVSKAKKEYKKPQHVVDYVMADIAGFISNVN